MTRCIHFIIKFNVSMKVFVILLWRILTSPFNFQDISKITIARIFISLTKVGFSRIKRTKTEKQVELKIRGEQNKFLSITRTSSRGARRGRVNPNLTIKMKIKNTIFARIFQLTRAKNVLLGKQLPLMPPTPHTLEPTTV